MYCGARRGSVGHQARGAWPLESTDQAEAPIGMSLVVKPVMKMTVNEGEAVEAEEVEA